VGATKSNERPGNDWFSKAEICRFHGIAEQTFDKTYRGILPPTAQKKIGMRAWFNGPAYFDAVVAKKVADAKPVGTGDDPLLAGGGDSPNLEEYRKHKARIAKVEADELEKIVVRNSVIEPLLLNALGLIKRSLEIVERQFGREAIQPVVEAIDAAIEAIEKHFANDGSAGTKPAVSGAGRFETGAAADDEGVRGK
jgi:hypothetical protein